MNIAKFSIKRPIFITSIVLLILITGLISLSRLGVDLYPDINFPFVIVQTVYQGAAPEEIENLVSKPIEDEISSISGVKRISSRNLESVSLVIVEFNLGIDVKYAEQQVRDKTAKVRPTLPDGIDEPLIFRFDPADQAAIRYALSADLPRTELYDLAKEVIKPQIEQVQDVAGVDILGGVRREIQVELDRRKLSDLALPAVSVAQSLKSHGLNIPVGKYEKGPSETIFRAVAQFVNLKQIENATLYFMGDPDNAITLKKVASVRDGAEDEKTLGFLYAPVEETRKGKKEKSGGFFSRSKKKIEREYKPAMFLDVHKQSGANTVAVVDAVIKRVGEINKKLEGREGNPRLIMVLDNALAVRINIKDVRDTILIGIALAVIVVYFFLGNIRSTIITGIALPNSLLGAFVLMYVMGFTINIMTLLALSLCVGLLVDDAIVVRENIFRKLETGMPPVEAAEKGTTEVMLAVIATTFTIIAVFFPMGFLSGIVGQFFKQFGFTVVFAMLISLFDALTVAPLLSAYFAGKAHTAQNAAVRAFDRFQRWVQEKYSGLILFAVNRPFVVLLIATGIFFLSLLSLLGVKRTFMPPNDFGEFMVVIEMPPGTSLQGTYEVTKKIEDIIKAMPQVNKMSTVVGNTLLESNKATIGISLVDSGERKENTTQMKEKVRKAIKGFEIAKPKVADYGIGGIVDYPFYLNLLGDDLNVLEEYGAKVAERLTKKAKDLTEVSSSIQGGKPEFQVRLDSEKTNRLGVSPQMAGAELRYHIAGEVVGKLHDRGIEYDVRMRLKPDQRDLESNYREIHVPNMHMRLIPLTAISTPIKTDGHAIILRESRSRVVQIYANLAPDGAIDSAQKQAEDIMKKELPPPKGVSYKFWGQAESYQELFQNIIIAFFLSLIFIYLVLSSLYESFITPVTILMALPPALSGAFLALFFTGEMLNIFSMIGVIMLMGLVTKNSILLVDFAIEGVHRGMSRKEAIMHAGEVRLRPILMTTFAMLAGTLPIALGIGEASRFRMAMGIAIIGGIILSTFMTLLVVPALFEFVDIVREKIEGSFRPSHMTAVEVADLEHRAEELVPYNDEEPGLAVPPKTGRGRSRR